MRPAVRQEGRTRDAIIMGEVFSEAKDTGQPCMHQGVLESMYVGLQCLGSCIEPFAFVERGADQLDLAHHAESCNAGAFPCEVMQLELLPPYCLPEGIGADVMHHHLCWQKCRDTKEDISKSTNWSDHGR